MPRPATPAPEWASDANYPAGPEPEAGFPTKVAPTSGQADVGWRPDQIPPAEEENWWKNNVWLWLAYLQEITAPKWKWIAAEAATVVDADFTPIAGRGMVGTVGQSASAVIALEMPVGTRILKVGIKVKHVAGEVGSGVNGGITLYKTPFELDGTATANLPIVVQGDPPASIPAQYTGEIIANNGAGALWETLEFDVEQGVDADVVLSALASWVIWFQVSGAKQVQAVGYQYQLVS